MHASMFGPHCFGVLIVKPEGRFSRKKLDAQPKQWKGVRWAMPPLLTKERAEEDVAKYNRSAQRLGWSSWAILWCDEDRKRFEDAGEAARVLIPRVLPSGKTSEYDCTGLELHMGQGVLSDKGHIRISLDCGYLLLDDWKTLGAAELRQIAIEQVEKTLAEVKAAAQKTRRKRLAVA